MQNLVQKGDTINATNGTGGTVLAGAGMLIGAMVGIAVNDVLNGAVGVFHTEGVYSHAKDNAASSGGGQGDIAYWDAGSADFTADPTGNTQVGKFWEANVDGDTTCIVKINV